MVKRKQGENTWGETVVPCTPRKAWFTPGFIRPGEHVLSQSLLSNTLLPQGFSEWTRSPRAPRVTPCTSSQSRKSRLQLTREPLFPQGPLQRDLRSPGMVGEGGHACQSTHMRATLRARGRLGPRTRTQGWTGIQKS